MVLYYAHDNKLAEDFIFTGTEKWIIILDTWREIFESFTATYWGLSRLLCLDFFLATEEKRSAACYYVSDVFGLLQATMMTKI